MSPPSAARLSWFILLLAALTLCVGCPDEEAGDDDSGAPGDDDDTGPGDDDDDDDDDDTVVGDDDTSVDLEDPCSEEPLDAEIDDSCVPSTGTNDLVLIRATAILPDGALPNAEVLFSAASGEILCVDEDCSGEQGHAEATLLCGDVVLPAFVDPHNHMQYNVLGPWPHGQLWENRYEWRGDGDYWDYTDLVDQAPNCDVMAWAELRAIMTGSGTVAGSYLDGCDPMLLRNVDEGVTHHYLSGYDVEIRTNDPDTDFDDLGDWADDLDSGDIAAYVPHCAEGLYGTVRGEFEPLVDEDLVHAGTALVHGTDLDPKQLTRMALGGAELIWSPQSNIDLYGRTADVSTARNLGVTVALGPDWTLSGTAGQLFELQCAERLNREAYHGAFCLSEIVAMATTHAAAALGLDGVLGELVAGQRADLLLLSGDGLNPYTSVLTATQPQVELVVVDGVPLYGDAALMDVLPPGSPFMGDLCDAVDVCGEDARVCFRTDAADRTYDELRDDLTDDLGAHLFPTLFCPDDPDYEPQRCAPTGPRGPGAADTDSDGVDDADDLCPLVFDPDQRDEDGDGKGNACDPLVWEPGTTGDSQVTADDLDGDGVPNASDGCEWLHGADDTDTDGDGLADACDPCPDDDDTACTTVPILRDWLHPLHPYEWDWVSIAGMVVTGQDDEFDFYVQDTSLAEWGGVFTYELEGRELIEPGHEVHVEGLYQEYYGQSEICFGTVTELGNGAVPAPIALSHPADLDWSTDLRHALEGMLVEMADAGGFEVTAVDAEYNEFQLEGCLWVDDDLYTGLSLPQVGDRATRVTGVVRYSHHCVRISPRDAADLEMD